MSTRASKDIGEAIESAREEILTFLCDLIRFPSIPGQEAEAVICAAKWFGKIAQVERIPLSNAIREDPDFADPVPGIEYDGRSNLRVLRLGSGAQPALLFNTHLDVVPASKGQIRPFDPRNEDGVVRGRGACDAKGQVATLFGAFLVLERLNFQLDGEVIAHLVVEEEAGGNGSLAMVRRGEQASACIVMEPTELCVHSSVRGAVWFRVVCQGKPGHSGSGSGTLSALKMAIRVIQILEHYHDRLLASSRGIALFDQFPNPMPITFGKLQAGDWPATAPSQAVIEGVLGLLPNKTRYQVMEEMEKAIRDSGDPWLRENFQLQFMYRHDAHVLPEDHPLAVRLSSACRMAGASGEITAATASSDSWFYNNQLRIPTVQFGPGSLSFAHTNEEQISWQEIRVGVETLVRFMADWLGAAS